jgi:hypothetical protein
MSKVPDLKNLPKVDMKTINRYLSPRAMNDFNAFLEKLPQNAGQTILIAAGITWGFAAALGLFTTIKAQDLNNLRAQLQDAKALMPVVPQMVEMPVEASVLNNLAKRLSDVYRNLEIRAENGQVIIGGAATNLFSPFREAVLQVNNGGQDWKVTVESMCVGRECKQKQLSIILKVAKIQISKPESAVVNYEPGSIPERE